MEIYKDEKHPEHQAMKTWAESLYFREYDPAWINDRLNDIKYKKTEWDKIKHERYQIIEDKYRKK